LLLDPRHPTGITARSIFKSKSIFYAAFKEEYNMTPTEWMKKNL
jgi:AraC-like DNA-binding protein